MNATGRYVHAAVVALAIAAALAAPTASAEIVIKRDPSKAVYVPPAQPPPASLDSADGFQLDDAAIGAAGMLTLLLGAAGVVSLQGRNRRRSASHAAPHMP
jgi:hypothetical protein